MTVQFGVFVPQIRIDLAGMRARAVAAEDAGFDSFWLADHLYSPGTRPVDVLESWTLLTALAGATSNVRLGHMVACNPFRHPAVMAKTAATLDQVSGGRFELGIGWGSVEPEFETFGIPVGSRRERAEQLGETLEIFRAMCTGEVFDYSGKHFQLRGAYGLPVPVQERIPVHIGGGGAQLTMPLVAQHADWWNCVGYARDRFDELAALRGSARISGQYPVGLAATAAEVDEVRAVIDRRMPEGGWGTPILGTADAVIEQLVAEHERGVELFVLRFHDFGEPETLGRFGRDVITPLRVALAG
ncbi:LLM class flavin-dependent oxidoreductase [Aldersonia kunmingensis]|uniref:LLM class flavin-dependent oxidoreductase n=1 Tax=Aldersonia kunmingensis TaxID=408066 RepID=UPI00082D1201|nr:LLM class flavin-dependent oxidoreductase [Aldersonia kunmingensis]